MSQFFIFSNFTVRIFDLKNFHSINEFSTIFSLSFTLKPSCQPARTEGSSAWFNPKTGESTWTMPEELREE